MIEMIKTYNISQRLYYHQNSQQPFEYLPLICRIKIQVDPYRSRMFKSKQKEQKKAKSSKSIALNPIDSYYQKTKSSHFDIFLNSGPQGYDLEGKNLYAKTVSVDRCEEFLDSLVKGFSSIYQMDHKAFEWKNEVQDLIKTGKQLLKIIDRLKQESKVFEQKKVKTEQLITELSQIRQKHKELQEKYDKLLQSSVQGIANTELYIKAQQRIKDLQIQQKIFNQKDKELRQIKIQHSTLIEHNLQMKAQIDQLTEQNSQLKEYLCKIIGSSYCEQTIGQVGRNMKALSNSNQRISKTNSLKQNQLAQSRFEAQILTHPFLSSIIVSYLSPKSICSLMSLTRTSRFFLLHTPKVIKSCFRSIIGYKNYQISFFHRHIDHFQNQIKKIPEEIVQSTFYQFNILKENVGGDFVAILHLCANIFQGKFNPQTTLAMNKTVKQYVQSKQILHYVESPKEQEYFLKIDKQLVEYFFKERKVKKQQIMKEIEQMAQKIILAENLYSVDSETLCQFHQTITRHFTILFVLAKHLFAQSRSLQYLNGFLLSELNQITRFKIEKEYDLEDIKAELESSNRMCLFLSEKCKNSEQRILRQAKQQLQTQRHVGRLAETIKTEQKAVKHLQSQLAQKQLQMSKIKHKYSELKALFIASRQKYNRLVNELVTVKQTIHNIK